MWLFLALDTWFNALHADAVCRLYAIATYFTASSCGRARTSLCAQGADSVDKLVPDLRSTYESRIIK